MKTLWLCLFSAPASQSVCFLWLPTLMDNPQKMQSGFASGSRKHLLTLDMERLILKALDMLYLVLGTLFMLDTIIL